MEIYGRKMPWKDTSRSVFVSNVLTTTNNILWTIFNLLIHLENVYEGKYCTHSKNFQKDYLSDLLLKKVTSVAETSLGDG